MSISKPNKSKDKSIIYTGSVRSEKEQDLRAAIKAARIKVREINKGRPKHKKISTKRSFLVSFINRHFSL